MPKKTNLLIEEQLHITDIGHRLAIDDIHHHRSVLELSEPQLVRRVKVYRDASGNIHLELEE
jgi:hypothetical protein